jgi:hypothetical protein
METACQHLSDFVNAEMDIVHKHLDEHKYLRGIPDKAEALASFINDYGWLIRELYCSRICEKRSECQIAVTMIKDGDLLKHHLKSFDSGSLPG